MRPPLQRALLLKYAYPLFKLYAGDWVGTSTPPYSVRTVKVVGSDKTAVFEAAYKCPRTTGKSEAWR